MKKQKQKEEFKGVAIGLLAILGCGTFGALFDVDMQKSDISANENETIVTEPYNASEVSLKFDPSLYTESDNIYEIVGVDLDKMLAEDMAHNTQPETLDVVPKEEVTPQDVDLKKLAKAVAMHESGHMTSSACKTKNNCWGIMTWERGYRELKTFDSYESGEQYFMNLWKNSYGGFPDIAKARKYSGNDRAENWLKNVTQFYNEQ